MIGCTIVSGCTGNQMLRKVTCLSTILALRGSTSSSHGILGLSHPGHCICLKIICGGSPLYVISTKEHNHVVLAFQESW